MSISYFKHEEYPDSILIRKFEGVIDLNEILNSWEYLISNNMLHDNIKGVINNISGAELQMNMEGFQKLIGYLKTQEKLKKIRLAVVSTDPNMIVFPILGETREKELGIKAFSSEEAAVEWVMKSV